VEAVKSVDDETIAAYLDGDGEKVRILRDAVEKLKAGPRPEDGPVLPQYEG
jgi:hypothetical protein